MARSGWPVNKKDCPECQTASLALRSDRYFLKSSIWKESEMFDNLIDKLNVFPESVKNAILFLALGWIWHYIALYTNFLKGQIPTRQLIIGASMFFLVHQMTGKKGWARALCMLCNVFIIVQYLPLVVTFFGGGAFKFGLIAGLTVLLFSTSTYYFAIKESSVFFKKQEKQNEESLDKV